ncbi:MAG: ABC transporter permease [Fibrobacter sp.]|nr:ABC transporter permease [Fibrobacter sp.]
MLKDFFRTIRKLYFSHNLVLWLIMLVLPVGVSVFMVGVFSAEIIQHIPVGIVKQDRSQLADELEQGLRASPVIDVRLVCAELSECEHAVVRGDLQAFIVLPYEMERRALRMETPVVPIYSSGQNYLTNTFATKEIRTVFSTIGANIFTKSMAEPVRVQLQSVGNTSGNYQGFLGMGLVTAVFHLAAILVAVYIMSYPFRDRRVKEFLDAAGGSRVVLGLASILPLVVILWLSLMAVYAYTHRFLTPMTLDEFIVVSAGHLAMVLACTGLGAAFVGITGNMRMSSSAAGVIAGPAFAFAGQTFPLMAMPFAVRCFAFMLPLTHILKAQAAMLLGPIGKAHAWESIEILLGMALFWHLLAGRLMFMRWKRAANHESAGVEEVDDD